MRSMSPIMPLRQDAASSAGVWRAARSEKRERCVVQRLAAFGEGVDDAEMVQARKDLEVARLRLPRPRDERRLAPELAALLGAYGDYQGRVDRRALVVQVEAARGLGVEAKIGVEAVLQQRLEVVEAAD